MTRPGRPWHHRLFDDASPYVDRFGLVLGVTVVSVVLLSLVEIVGPSAPTGEEVGSLLASAIVAVTLLLALRASGFARRWQRWVDVVLVVGLLSLGGRIVLERTIGFTPVVEAGSAPAVLVVILAVLAPVVVVRRLLQHRQVTRGTLIGAISAYLLIPVAYFYAFVSLDSLGGAPFFGTPQPTTSFMYFSLATVTTVGYGDLAPTTPPARLLATSEAFVGQVYLVVFVAMLVGLAAVRWRGSRADGDQVA